MAVTQIELGRRLKAARENCGLTQKQVADALGLARTALVQIEAGRRAVNSLELDSMARMYGRALIEFLSEGAPEDDPVLALFRITPGVAEDARLGIDLRRCAGLCREATRLEQLLGLPGGGAAMSISYAPEPPSTKWEAICQGRSLAEQERNRLGLGASPVWEIAEIIRAQGIRVAEYPMPGDISGLFLHSRELGLVVVVNRNHTRNRRLFSYAHEYCHVLADRQRPGAVSRTSNREELLEIRANAFAAHFLMPETGVRAFLQTIGKGAATRQTLEVFDDSTLAERGEQISVQKRMSPGSQTVHVHDLVGLAHNFGVSYEAALYHLLNLKVISNDRFEILKKQRELGARVARALRIGHWDEDAHWSLTQQVLALGFEAYRRSEISRNKLLELAREVDVPKKELEAALADNDDEEEAVDAIAPEWHP
jgi:Zn-dependent peptidase ImmA (M78 family)/transcriptional regulator with XRE-family HTH domain